MTMREAMVMRVVTRAVSGDLRALRLLLDRIDKVESRDATSSPAAIKMTEADREVLRGINERISAIKQRG